jgi:hypothetical protein
MAHRPVFAPTKSGQTLVNQVSLPLVWSPGFALVQKAKNVKALHDAAHRAGYDPVLEVSSKSDLKLGRHLSAFHLRVHTESHGDIPLECAFQGSKVFERGGPYADLYQSEVRVAKRDPRLRASGRLISFLFDGMSFPTTPPTMFYDWLYLGAIHPHRQYLVRLQKYAAFTDIEFNPERSINCQARSCALFVSLMLRGLLDEAVSSVSAFRNLLARHSYWPPVPPRSNPGLFRLG